MAENLAISDFTTEELADLLGFDPEEVKENRAGKISVRQRKRMRFLSSVFLIFVPIFAYQAYNNTSIAMLSWCDVSCKVFSLGRLAISIIGISAMLGLFLRMTIWIPKVSSKAGILKVKGGLLSGIRWYPIQIKDKKLSIGWTTKRLRLARGEYESYVQAYYLNTFWPIFPILSAEPIDEVAYQKNSG
jgi:hypothetical protein